VSEEEVIETVAEPADPEPPVVPMDCDPSGWKLAEQMAYRSEVGVNPQYAMLMIGKAFESEDPEKYTNIDPSWLLGIAWITARRKDKFVKLAAMAQETEYSELLRSVLKWAEERVPESDPTPAPKRAARKQR
jgi:hypothetical protein